MTLLLVDGPATAPCTLVLTHGAGAPMDSELLNSVVAGLVARGHRVVRFEFPYMAGRRTGGRRGPPDPAAVLRRTWLDVIAEVGARNAIIGGHSMGGRYATMVADESGVRGVVSLAYPWHPPGKPDAPRVQHLQSLKTPALLLCGERDEFGTREEVAGYGLSSTIEVRWLRGADHSLKGGKKHGRTTAEIRADVVDAMDGFIRKLTASA